MAEIVAVRDLAEFRLPDKILKLADVSEYGRDRDSGEVTIVQGQIVEYKFEMIDTVFRYEGEIKYKIERNKMMNIRGVSVRAATGRIWTAVGEIAVDPPSGMIHFTSFRGYRWTFSVDAFM